MSWLTIVWSMDAAACLTLAALHLAIWFKQRDGRAPLFFAASAVAAAALAGFELASMRAETPDDYGELLWWSHIPFWALIVSLVLFVRVYLRAGRAWLMWSICGLRTITLVLNFFSTPNVNFRQITGLRELHWWGGETVVVPVGTPNPWTLIGQFSLLVLVVFLVDATRTVWRRGERRRALVVGGSMIVFITVATGQVVLVIWGVLSAPFIVSLAYLGVIVAMGSELTRDVLRAAQLARDLRESEKRMELAVRAAEIGLWVWDVRADTIWVTDRIRTLFGYTPAETIDLNRFLHRVRPDDRERVNQAVTQALNGDGEYKAEFRVITSDGTVRWVAGRGRVEFDATGRPAIMRGLSLDITARKQAEEAAHALSGWLLHAQEAERSRLARELHDDLSQRLALLAVELDLCGQSPPAAAGDITRQLQAFSAQVRELSSEVHRLAHELHPAKLEQLGLAAAVSGFCQEFAQAHEIAIHCVAAPVPRAVPNELVLCLYRVTQEALQNVVKHSAATEARVTLSTDETEVRLVIADNGQGFDPAAARTDASLGLVSMRERARLVRGQLVIESRPGEGVRVELCVPLPRDPAAGS